MQYVPSKPGRDVYESITGKIMAAMELGTDAFVMPWHHAGSSVARPKNALTKALYQGVNVLALWAEATIKQYETGLWASYRQWQQLDAQVRKGEKGTVIVFFKSLENVEEDAEDSSSQRPKRVARASRVFNAAQVDGWSPPEIPTPSRVEALSAAESFIAGTKANIRYGGLAACYHSAGDYIEMPNRERFCGTPTSSPTESFYAVLLHEIVHWSGAKHRLDRDLKSRFGSASYAAEELIAELGAAFLCSDLSITNEPRPDHATYIQSWLKVFEEDKKAVFTAASQAHKAVEYLNSMVAFHRANA